MGGRASSGVRSASRSCALTGASAFALVARTTPPPTTRQTALSLWRLDVATARGSSSLAPSGTSQVSAPEAPLGDGRLVASTEARVQTGDHGPPCPTAHDAPPRRPGAGTRWLPRRSRHRSRCDPRVTSGSCTAAPGLRCSQRPPCANRGSRTCDANHRAMRATRRTWVARRSCGGQQGARVPHPSGMAATATGGVLEVAASPAR